MCAVASEERHHVFCKVGFFCCCIVKQVFMSVNVNLEYIKIFYTNRGNKFKN